MVTQCVRDRTDDGGGICDEGGDVGSCLGIRYQCISRVKRLMGHGMSEAKQI